MMKICFEKSTPKVAFKRAREFIATLREHKIGLLLDIRLRAQSRKAGFSKTRLAEMCEESSVEYRHERKLGTPKELLEEVRAGGGYTNDHNERYRQHMVQQQDALMIAESLARVRRVCLLCFEAEATNCHRLIVAEELANRINGVVVNL